MSIPNPVVLLDARAHHVHPAFRMTRGSTKSVFDRAGRLVTVPAHAMGWDCEPERGEARGYLAEAPATNRLLRSNDLAHAAWSKLRASITPNAIVGPAGTGVGKLVEDTQNGGHLVYQDVAIPDGAITTYSVVARAAERTQVMLYIQNPDNAPEHARVSFDVAGGAVISEANGESAVVVASGIEALGEGFYRAWIAGQLSAGVTAARYIPRLLDDSGNQSYAGDNASGMYLGHMQAEIGAAPTSYIETAGATAMRAGDLLLLPGLVDSPWWRSGRGTLLVDVHFPIAPPESLSRIWRMGGSSLLRLSFMGSGSVRLYFGADEVGVLVPNGQAPGTHRRIALAWGDGSEWVGAVDGAITAGGAFPANLDATSLALGSNHDGGDEFNGHIRRAIYYPARLSNADLQSLTAIQE